MGEIVTARCVEWYWTVLLHFYGRADLVLGALLDLTLDRSMLVAHLRYLSELYVDRARARLNELEAQLEHERSVLQLMQHDE